MEYGTKIDEYDPNREVLYDIITEFFENPVLTKIKDIDTFSIYMAKVNYILYTENRYIIAFMHKDDSSIGTLIYLKDLKWQSFQTRSLPHIHKIIAFSYIPKKTLKFQSKIYMLSRSSKETSYKCENHPITITLLHKGNSEFEFSEKGTLASALETWRTILTFN